MPKSKWLEEVALALGQQRLSSAYIRRFMDELADHCEDLCTEAASMDASSLSTRLGTPDELAGRAKQELRQRTYAGRHPVVTFLAAPLPTAAALVIVLCIAFVLMLNVLPEPPPTGEQVPMWAAMLLQAFVWSMRYVPFLAGAILFCHLAKRAVCSPRWSFAACALMAVLAGLFAVNLTLPTNGPGSGTLMMGFGIPPGPPQLLQALTPLAVWLVYAAREFRRGRLVVAA